MSWLPGRATCTVMGPKLAGNTAPASGYAMSALPATGPSSALTCASVAPAPSTVPEKVATSSAAAVTVPFFTVIA